MNRLITFESTSEYFGIAADELRQEKPDADGYTREDRLVLDSTEESSPFSGTLQDAIEKADMYEREGYMNVIILKAVNQCDWYKYFVLAREYDPAAKAAAR